MSFGVKISPVNKFAVKLNTVIPNLVDLTLLCDVQKNITLSLMSRSIYYIAAGADIHIPLREKGPEVHFFVGGTYYLLNPYIIHTGPSPYFFYDAKIRVGLGLGE